jgi:hypothetical protein
MLDSMTPHKVNLNYLKLRVNMLSLKCSLLSLVINMVTHSLILLSLNFLRVILQIYE